MIDLPCKALSIRQPWVWAIINLDKRIENRGWWTSFRGPVCLHAAKGCTRDEFSDASDSIFDISGQRPPALRDIHRGGIVAVAEIVDCVAHSESPWFFGRYGFVLANVEPVPFIGMRGALGFFNWSSNNQAAKPPRQGVLL